MARKSKRVIEEKEPMHRADIYSAAVYIRLSVEDRLYKNGSDSMKNQEELIREYLKDKSDIKIYDVYRDNGETGTDFKRGDFLRMMHDVYNGKVNCIIVKDLSRFGREYIEAGVYLERIFPLMGVRFIAVNDRYDNKVNPVNIAVPIKNIINTLYARDLSRKSAAALRIKQSDGEFIGTYAAYGYLKSPADKHKLIIDAEAAPVVKMIFEWKADGMSSNAICRRLYDMNVMPPSRYLYDKGLIKDKRYKNNTLWRTQTVRAMLENEVYIGNLTQGRKKSYFFNGGKGAVKSDKSDWVVVRNTHEAIVSKELFDSVQKIIAERRAAYRGSKAKRNAVGGNDNLFKGHIICGDCGAKLTRVKTAVPDGKDSVYIYRCPRHAAFPSLCSFASIGEKCLNDMVLKSINMQISCLTDISAALKKASDSKAVRQKKLKLTRETGDIISEISYIKAGRIRTAANYAQGVSDDSLYKAEIDGLNAALKAETDKLDAVNKKNDKIESLLSAAKWVDKLTKYNGGEKLTQKTADAFVKAIKVYPDKRIEVKLMYDECCFDKDGDRL